MRSGIRTISATTPTATATRTTAPARARRLRLRSGAGAVRAVPQEPAERAVRRRPGLRRSHDHDRRELRRSRAAIGSPPSGTSTLEAGVDRRRQRLADRLRARRDSRPAAAVYVWQNDFTLPLGALSVALERREERLDTDAGVCGHRARHQRGRRRLPVARRPAARCRLNLRRDDSTQYGGADVGALAYALHDSRPGCARARATAPASRRRPSTISTIPGFSNPEPAARRPRATSRPRFAMPTAQLNAGIVAYRNRVRDLIVFECDAAVQLRAAERGATRRSKASRSNSRRSFGATMVEGEHRLAAAVRRRDRQPAAAPRAPLWRARRSTQAFGSLQLGVRADRVSRHASTTPPTRGAWAATRCVNLTAE